MEVKVLQAIQRHTPITYEYVGQVQAQKEVQIKAKVSGNVVAKMVEGGASVQAGQPLFQIDRRQYEAALLNAKAQLAQAEAALSNSRLDVERYKKLAAQGGISQQTLDTAMSAERQNAAVVEACRARVQQAEADLEDTLMVAPFSGRIEINELSFGGFVQAGSTVLATLSSVDPVFVQFSMSENEYLRLTRQGDSPMQPGWGDNLRLVLSDGTTYPLTGRIEQVNRGMTQETGSITFKASFANPRRQLLPGMYARVIVQGEVRKGAILIPQRAVQQTLDKTFVTIVGQDNKIETREIKLGPKVGNLQVVENGVGPSDLVVVEGFAKVQPGMVVKPVKIELKDLEVPARK